VNRTHNCEKVGFEKRQNNLSFGIAEAAVVFYNLRTLWCQHKPEVKAALKGSVFVVHSLNCGQEYLFGTFLCDFGRVVGVRCNRSHSACIESLVAVKSTLVVHGRNHGNYGFSVGERENGNLGTS